VKIAILASPLLSSRWEHAVDGEHTILATRYLADFLSPSTYGRPHLYVLQPTLLSRDEVTACSRFSSESQRPLVVHCALSELRSSGVLRVLSAPVSAVVLTDIDDTPLHLTSILKSIPDAAYSLRVLRRLMPQLRSLPVDVAGCVALTFLPAGAHITVAKQFVRQGTRSRRTIDRHLQTAGLPPLAVVLLAAQVANALPALLKMNLTLAAREAGYADPRTLKRHIVRMTGLNLPRLRELDAEMIVDLVVNRLIEAVT
jgi:hypothetical protein